MKKLYYATFIPGMERAVEGLLRREGGVTIERMLDVYKRQGWMIHIGVAADVYKVRNFKAARAAVRHRRGREELSHNRQSFPEDKAPQRDVPCGGIGSLTVCDMAGNLDTRNGRLHQAARDAGAVADRVQALNRRLKVVVHQYLG